MSAETPVERRLRELAKAFSDGTPTQDAIDAAREAIALLRRIADGDIDESRIVKTAATFASRLAQEGT